MIDVIAVSQELARGGETVNALPRRAIYSFLGSLIGHRAEESSLLVVPATLVPVVADHGNIIFLSHPDDFRIGERGRTARDDVVSAAPQGVAVHFPEQDGLALSGRLATSFPQLRCPGNLRPFILAGMGLDEHSHLL